VTASIILLTEQALTAADAARIIGLYAPDAPSYRVLVPADTGRSLLADVLDHLSLLELREALDAVRGRDEDDDRVTATKALDASVTELRAVGMAVDGSVVEGDPVAALQTALDRQPADEVVIVTRPHAVEDTFHTDWASRARERLGVPVLHVYAGSSWLG
jgi:hypothetical protein